MAYPLPRCISRMNNARSVPFHSACSSETGFNIHQSDQSTVERTWGGGITREIWLCIVLLTEFSENLWFTIGCFCYFCICTEKFIYMYLKHRAKSAQIDNLAKRVITFYAWNPNCLLYTSQRVYATNSIRRPWEHCGWARFDCLYWKH